MKHDNFERKKHVNTPYINRAKTILLKQAICQAKSAVLEMIGANVSLGSINRAVGYIDHAKTVVKVALEDGYLSYEKLEKILHFLHHASYLVGRKPLVEASEIAVSLYVSMPEQPPVKHRVPRYRMTNLANEWLGVAVVNHNQPENANEAAASMGGAK